MPRIVQHGSCAVFLLLLSCGHVTGNVVDGLNELWTDTAKEAAEETLRLIKLKTNLDLSLRNVPLDTLQIFVGKQHHIGIEVDGVQYDVMQDLPDVAQALPAHKLLQLPASALEPRNWRQLQEHSLALPEVTLSGPVELWLSKPAAVSLFLPLATDAGIVSRLMIAEGATVRIQGMKGIALRQPVELPRLPAQYLAEVLAHVKLGVPEEGFHNAPGILYMASELQRAALNTTLSFPLLSFEVEPASASGLSMASVQARPADAHKPPPRLKARKLKGGALELSLRPGQVVAATAEADSLGAQIAQLHALSRPSAWPLPYLDMVQWVPYETMLRSILASHPFNVDSVQRRGVGLRLTRSAIKGISLMAFEMEVRGQLPDGAGQAAPESGYAEDEGTVEVWEAVVQVDKAKLQAAGAAMGTGLAFTPLRVQRKEQYQNTVSLSRAAVAGLQFGAAANSTLPVGFEELEMGIARSAD